MRTIVGHLSWVDRDARMAIAAQATRSFAQSAVAVLIVIYLGLHGFSLVQGAFLTVGAVGAALAAVVAECWGTPLGAAGPRDLGAASWRSPGSCSLRASFPVLLIAAFVGNLSGVRGGGGRVRSNRPSWPSL